MNLLKDFLDFKHNCYWYVTFSWIDKWNNNLAQILYNRSSTGNYFWPNNIQYFYMQDITHQIVPGFLSPFYSKYVKEVENHMFHHLQKNCNSQNIYLLKIENIRLKNRLMKFDWCNLARYSAMDVSKMEALVWSTNMWFPVRPAHLFHICLTGIYTRWCIAFKVFPDTYCSFCHLCPLSQNAAKNWGRAHWSIVD